MSDVSPTHHPTRGGRRDTTLRARYTEQATGLVMPITKEAIKAVADEYGVSQSVVVRLAIELGLDKVRARLSREAVSAAVAAA